MKQESNKVGLIALWVVNTAALVLLAFALLVLVPRVSAIFADYGTRLPPTATAVVELADNPAGVAAGLGVFLAVQILACTLSEPSRSFLLTISTLLLVLLIVGITLVLGLPFVSLINEVSGQSGAAT